MEMINLLKVSRETRKTIKEQAIRLHNKGKNESEIADALNISYQAVSRIIRAYKKEGMHSVKEKIRGRKQGVPSRRRKYSESSLTNAQIR